MKTKKSIIVLFLSFVSLGLSAQNKFENKQFGISFIVPSSWSENKDKQLINDLERLEISEENLSGFIAKNGGEVQLVTYNKYNNGHSVKTKINPTINVVVRLNNTQNFNDFYKNIEENTEKIKSYYSNVDYSVMPTEINISGLRAIYYVGDYTMQKNKRKELVFEKRDYIIPCGKYYIEIELSDGTHTEDNSALFDEIIKTIELDIKK